MKTTVLFLTLITTALSAGLFYAWVVSVIPGTKQIGDQAYLETMQSINRAILNPAFFISFIGAALGLCVSTFLQYQVKVDTCFYLFLSATLIYSLGTVGVTMFGNVPLNNVVEAMDLTSFGEADFKSARELYEGPWNRLNGIRTVAAVLAFVLALLATWKSGNVG